MTGKFRCAMCGGVFDKTRSDEEAMAEARALFGDVRPDEVAAVCEDCFKRTHPENHPHIAEEAMAEILRARGVGP